MRRRSALAVCLVLLTGACTNEASRASPSPSLPPSASASSTSVLVERATSVLVTDLGPGADQPGISPGAPGGLTPKGPTSVAVDDDWIYLWDQANQRLLLYELH